MDEVIRETLNILRDIVVMDTNYIRKTMKRQQYIEGYLQDNKIDYHTLEFYVPVPDFVRFELYADGEQIRVLPDGLESEKIEGPYLKDSADLDSNYPLPQHKLLFQG